MANPFILTLALRNKLSSPEGLRPTAFILTGGLAPCRFYPHRRACALPLLSSPEGLRPAAFILTGGLAPYRFY
ncbi:MAG: hypothetical protein ACKO3V_13465, partial [Pirellula sp.]